MPLHLPGDLYVDVPLTRAAVANFQKASRFLAPFAFPRMIVDKPSGTYDKLKTGDLNRDEMKVRGPNSPAQEGTFGYEQATYKVPTESLAYSLNDTQRKAASVTRDPSKTIPRILTLKALIRLERMMAAKMFLNTSWFRTVTGGGADAVTEGATSTRKKFSDQTSDLVKALLDESNFFSTKAGIDPDALIFGRDAWISFRTNDSVIAALNVAGVPVSRNRPATLQEVASLLELDYCGVSKATYNTAGENEATSNAKIVPAASALLYYRGAGKADDPGMWTDEMPVAGACQVWRDGAGNDEGLRIRRFRDEKAGAGGSDHSEIDTFRDYGVVTSEMGTIFESMV